ncbi:pyridoxamine 5'-phosphate oxidase family protein [Lacihabitans sp. LS3-19]|uniref:pyridoxamine 5'-phosphate oxidase family protein n=1 Tax=Lacihabitans sp. LS3-19 TaxID=2487335 RepID=UPI0020CFD501|nr:pyridoxamine 5'-phosphate oxidase family protein [Lacihabitans sp. LS3-19]MCP9766343.1 pyridoxamine 5'-phosphate oxidase family protein [Lacihabitans sp. LS3-19]
MIQKTQRTTTSRMPSRTQYDQELVYSILDEALFCTVSYSVDNQPFSIPTAFVRKENKLYIHGSVGSHFLRGIESGLPVCISVMLTDSLVVAKSAFHHSVNYRSVILFSNAVRHDAFEEKALFFQELTEKMVPNSWEYLRQMKASEVNKTMLLSFEISEASARMRTGMPNDDEEDKTLPIWSGIIPIPSKKLTPIADENSIGIELPKHLR